MVDELRQKVSTGSRERHDMRRRTSLVVRAARGRELWRDPRQGPPEHPAHEYIVAFNTRLISGQVLPDWRRKEGKESLTFLRRHAAHACWTCLRFTGSPPRFGSDATNLTFRAGTAAATWLASGGAADMATSLVSLFISSPLRALPSGLPFPLRSTELGVKRKYQLENGQGKAMRQSQAVGIWRRCVTVLRGLDASISSMKFFLRLIVLPESSKESGPQETREAGNTTPF